MANWITAGDFNMIEQVCDKLGGYQSTKRGQAEFTAWNALTIHLELHDSYLVDECRITTAKKFSWKSRRKNSEMICSRLTGFISKPSFGTLEVKPELGRPCHTSPTMHLCV